MTPSLLAGSAGVIAAAFAALWFHQRAVRNATLVDAAWALGIGLQTAFLAHHADGDYLRRLVVTALAGLWSLRLGGHLIATRVLPGHEDGRYAHFRAHWSQATWFGFYMLQAASVFLLPLTFLGALHNARPFPTAPDIAALALWVFSAGAEWLADRQLARFKADPANQGKTCRRGLWRYSRHPNYFFEWLIWISYVPLAWGSPYFWASLAGPALLFVLLTRVSGIPPTEAQALRSRGDDYRDYQRTTPAFAPWFPKE